MRFIVYSNWKMHLLQRDVAAYVAELRRTESRWADLIEFVLCASYPLIPPLVEAASGSPHIAPGAQNVHWEREGQWTGEVSAPQLADAGTRYCVVGHSERRREFRETDELVNRKALTLLAAGVTPIVCIGEGMAARRMGRAAAAIRHQLARCLRGVDAEQLARTVLLYEPVWAVGNGRNATADQVNEAHRLIRRLLFERYPREAVEAARIIYGGSVTPENAGELLAIDDIDGLGMGKASLDVERFMRVAEIARERLRSRPLRPLRGT